MKNRGAAPGDHQLFNKGFAKAFPAMAKSLANLWEKGYPEEASLKLTGDQYNLKWKQRQALKRSTLSPPYLKYCLKGAQTSTALKKANLTVDGFNLLITLETLLGKGPVFQGLDGCIRDVTGVHGTYKRAFQTSHALDIISEALNTLNTGKANWLLDKPVSNSGKLKALLEDYAHQNNLNWAVSLQDKTDEVLKRSQQIIISSDKEVLAKGVKWYDLNGFIAFNLTQEKWLISSLNQRLSSFPF